MNLFTQGLGMLPVISDWETRSISAENPDGALGGGAHALPQPNGPAQDLGPGWKARPCIVLEPGRETALAEIESAGSIQHIWFTVREQFLPSIDLKMLWDGEQDPSVEAPLGDFFANPHGRYAPVVSLPVAVNPTAGMNCYWPMPFAKRARIVVVNRAEEEIPDFFYQITYGLGKLPPNMGLFHAMGRRIRTSRERPLHIIADNIQGRGQYVGTVLGWNPRSDGWWGEGEIKFFLDGDRDHPTICGTGAEDYFGGAWCFGATFSAPFSGYPLATEASERPRMHSMYRWHVLDPIRFKEQLKVTIQALGWGTHERYQPLEDEISSVAYWYQLEPHAPFGRR